MDDAFGDGVDILQRVDAAFKGGESGEFDDALEFPNVFHAIQYWLQHHSNLRERHGRKNNHSINIIPYNYSEIIRST